MTVDQLINEAGCRSIAFLGLAKNAGKTTALNAAAAAARTAGANITIASIGRDGEAFDAVTGKPKPSVAVSRGDRIVTTDRMIGASGLDAVLELDTGLTGPLGRTGLYRVLSRHGSAVIAGINRVSAMTAVKDEVLSRSDLFFIDGAVNRRSFGVPELSDCIIVSTGAVLGGTCAEVASKTAEALSILRLPACEPTESPERIPIRGALTDSKVRNLLSGPPPAGPAVVITAADPTRIFLTQPVIRRLLHRGYLLRVEKSLNVIGITVNPHNPAGPDLPADDLLEAVAAEAAPAPVFNVNQ